MRGVRTVAKTCKDWERCIEYMIYRVNDYPEHIDLSTTYCRTQVRAEI